MKYLKNIMFGSIIILGTISGIGLIIVLIESLKEIISLF